MRTLIVDGEHTRIDMDITRDQAQIIEDVLVERKAQDDKWGVQEHEQGTWSMILLEELGEAVRAILQCRFDDAEMELVQCVAVGFAWLEHILRDKDS